MFLDFLVFWLLDALVLFEALLVNKLTFLSVLLHGLKTFLKGSFSVLDLLLLSFLEGLFMHLLFLFDDFLSFLVQLLSFFVENLLLFCP